MLKRLSKACKFFPCHEGLEDCVFCYCPFYPCLDEEKGRFIYSVKNKKHIWSCKSCSWIHKRKVAESIFTLIRKNGARPGLSPGFLGRMYKYQKQNLKSDKAGIIILSHGSKLKRANASLNETVRAIRQKTGLAAIVPAYLQFCQPDLEKSIKGFIAKGFQRIIIIPFFLFNGNHVTRDIPNIIEKEKEKYPKVNFIYTKNLGEDTRISDIMSEIVEEAVQSGNTY